MLEPEIGFDERKYFVIAFLELGTKNSVCAIAEYRVIAFLTLYEVRGRLITWLTHGYSRNRVFYLDSGFLANILVKNPVSGYAWARESN